MLAYNIYSSLTSRNQPDDPKAQVQEIFRSETRIGNSSAAIGVRLLWKTQNQKEAGVQPKYQVYVLADTTLASDLGRTVSLPLSRMASSLSSAVGPVSNTLAAWRKKRGKTEGDNTASLPYNARVSTGAAGATIVRADVPVGPPAVAAIVTATQTSTNRVDTPIPSLSSKAAFDSSDMPALSSSGRYAPPTAGDLEAGSEGGAAGSSATTAPGLAVFPPSGPASLDALSNMPPLSSASGVSSTSAPSSEGDVPLFSDAPNPVPEVPAFSDPMPGGTSLPSSSTSTSAPFSSLSPSSLASVSSSTASSGSSASTPWFDFLWDRTGRPIGEYVWPRLPLSISYPLKTGRLTFRRSPDYTDGLSPTSSSLAAGSLGSLAPTPPGGAPTFATPAAGSRIAATADSTTGAPERPAGWSWSRRASMPAPPTSATATRGGGGGGYQALTSSSRGEAGGYASLAASGSLATSGSYASYRNAAAGLPSAPSIPSAPSTGELSTPGSLRGSQVLPPRENTAGQYASDLSASQQIALAAAIDSAQNPIPGLDWVELRWTPARDSEGSRTVQKVLDENASAVDKAAALSRLLAEQLNALPLLPDALAKALAERLTRLLLGWFQSKLPSLGAGGAVATGGAVNNGAELKAAAGQAGAEVKSSVGQVPPSVSFQNPAAVAAAAGDAAGYRL